MKDVIPNRIRCPYCFSDNVVPISPKTFACTGAGGVVGGIIAALVGKGKAGGISAGSVAAGVITGAITGAGLSKAIHKNESGKPYLCLDCYGTFTGSQTDFPC
jgi:hypothetical protein